MLLRKNESSLEKKNSFTDEFQTSGNPVRKRKVHKMKVVIQNSANIAYHEFHRRPQKDLRMLILVTPIPLY